MLILPAALVILVILACVFLKGFISPAKANEEAEEMHRAARDGNQYR